MSAPILGSGDPFPLISQTDTDIWLDFWNITWKSWIESNGGSAGGDGSGELSTYFTQNGRLKETEADSVVPHIEGSPSLSIILPATSKYVLGGKLYVLDEDKQIGPFTPNFTGFFSSH